MSAEQQPVRLSKRMAELGLCSRREADAYIEKGWVRVNGKTAVLGQKVLPQERIELDRQAHTQQAHRVTILLNKPVGFVSGQPEKGYRAAAELITPENRWDGDSSRTLFQPGHTHRLAPAGRLDIDSTGLLVLTQDGRIAKQLIGENSNSEKEYLVRVSGSLKSNGLALLNHGLVLDVAERRPAPLHPETGQKTPNPPYVRAGRPARNRLEAHPHRAGETGCAAARKMALFAAERTLLELFRQPERT